MKLSEFAKKTGITYQTAWNWWKRGYLNGVKYPSGSVVIDDKYPLICDIPSGSQVIADRITVGTCGCFDILHAGHVYYLQESKKLGDKLIVLLNTDEWIRKNKREPVIPQEHRKMLLEALDCVDDVILFNTNEEKEELILEYKFNVWTKARKPGELRREEDMIEAPAVKSYGGRIVLIDSIYPDCSSSNIIKSIMNRSGPSLN